MLFHGVSYLQIQYLLSLCTYYSKSASSCGTDYRGLRTVIALKLLFHSPVLCLFRIRDEDTPADLTPAAPDQQEPSNSSDATSINSSSEEDVDIGSTARSKAMHNAKGASKSTLPRDSIYDAGDSPIPIAAGSGCGICGDAVLPGHSLTLCSALSSSFHAIGGTVLICGRHIHDTCTTTRAVVQGKAVCVDEYCFSKDDIGCRNARSAADVIETGRSKRK